MTELAELDAAWLDYSDRVKAAGQSITGPEFTDDPRLRAEGYRYVGQVDEPGASDLSRVRRYRPPGAVPLRGRHIDLRRTRTWTTTMRERCSTRPGRTGSAATSPGSEGTADLST